MIDEKVSKAVLFELLDFEAYFPSTEPEVFAFIHLEHIYQMTIPCQSSCASLPSGKTQMPLVTLSNEEKNEIGHTSCLA